MTYYIGTVILNMEPKVFWKTTPRKFNALCKMHAKVNSTEGEHPKHTKGSKTKKSVPIGQPDTFVDKIM